MLQSESGRTEKHPPFIAQVPRVDHNPTDDRPSISDQKKNRKHHGEVGAENGQVGWRRAKIGRVGGSVHRLYGLGGAAS